jgi:hypothetical protein
MNVTLSCFLVVSQASSKRKARLAGCPSSRGGSLGSDETIFVVHDKILKQTTVTMSSTNGIGEGFCAMQKAQDAGSAEIWRAAQSRRTEDLDEWLSPFVKQIEKSPTIKVVQPPQRPRLTLMRGLTIATIAFAALASVSAAVHAGKTPHFVLRPTAPLPAVNVS